MPILTSAAYWLRWPVYADPRLAGKCRSLTVAAPYIANWKSLVERYFGIINDLVIRWVPGAVKQRESERGERDVRLDAVLTLRDVQRLMMSLAAEWNLTHDMTNSASCAFLREAIPATPISFWNWGLQALHASPRYINRDDAIRQLLPSLKATINRRGIQALGYLRFKLEGAPAEDPLYELRGEDGARIMLDPDSPKHAYFPNPKTNQMHRVELVDTRQYDDEDVSLEEILVTEEFAELQQSDWIGDVNTVVSTERGYRDSVIAKATSTAKADKSTDTRSKRKKIGSIDENRAAERALGRPAAKKSEPQHIPATLSDNASWGDEIDEIFG
jgi:hypothetical protein